MPSPYFRSNFHDTGLQNLLQDLSAEVVRNAGVEGVWLRLTNRDEGIDDHWGQIAQRQYGNSAEIDFYLVTADGFQGENELFSRFGLELKDQIEISIARKTWEELYTSNTSGISDPRPFEGDILAVPFNNIQNNMWANADTGSWALFEARFVDHDQQFYQAGTLIEYRITCDRFDYTNEVFANTGYAGIDAITQDQDLSSSNTEVANTIADNNIYEQFDDVDFNPFDEPFQSANSIVVFDQNPFQSF